MDYAIRVVTARVDWTVVWVFPRFPMQVARYAEVLTLYSYLYVDEEKAKKNWSQSEHDYIIRLGIHSGGSNAAERRSVSLSILDILYSTLYSLR